MYFLFKIIIQSFAFVNNSFFVNNLDYINNMNLKNLSYKLDVNHFIDQPHFIKMNKFIKREKCHNCFNDESLLLPHSVDWREKNAVTSVKNQENCGSCWSFSSTGSIEGINAIKYKELYNISEQQLVDCSTKEGNHGCQGGLMDNAFKYVIDNGGLCSEEEYPYQGEEGLCQTCKNVVSIDDYSDVTPNDEKVLMRAVAHQPISVAIQANLSSFRFYKSGVYQDDECTDQLDHGVLIVGYGHELIHRLDYWIVKNSWGPEWGENGYIRILRNSDKKTGMCGIAIQPSFPIIR